jgi:hypothetical protein
MLVGGEHLYGVGDVYTGEYEHCNGTLTMTDNSGDLGTLQTIPLKRDRYDTGGHSVALKSVVLFASVGDLKRGAQHHGAE